MHMITHGKIVSKVPANESWYVYLVVVYVLVGKYFSTILRVKIYAVCIVGAVGTCSAVGRVVRVFGVHLLNQDFYALLASHNILDQPFMCVFL